MGCDIISTLKMEAARSSKMLLSYHIIIWQHNPEDHDLNFNAMKTSVLHFITCWFFMVRSCYALTQSTS